MDERDHDLNLPGTTCILDERGELIETDNYTLVPEPSSDPDDPLNWSQKRKNLQLFCIVLYAIAGCFVPGSLYAIYQPITEQTGLTLDNLNTGVGFTYLGIGLGATIAQPIALAIGKRPVYVFTSLALGSYYFWIVKQKTFGTWIAQAVIYGFLQSPIFTLCELSLSDTFFYHERAFPFGLYLAATYTAPLLAAVFSGYIYTSMGWHAPPAFASGFAAISAVFLFIFLEETNYTRAEPEDQQVHHISSGVDADKEGKAVATTAEVVPADTQDDKTMPTAQEASYFKTRMQTPWPGPRPWKMFKINPHGWGIIWRTPLFALLLAIRIPIIFWCGIMFGLTQVWYNTTNALASGVLSGPPYNFGPNVVGLTFLSPFLAIGPGAVGGGLLCDWWTIYRARRNHGISEAEHKLELFLIAAVLAPIGILMMGLGPYFNAHWICFVIGEFILSVAGPLAALLAINYSFDSYHEIKPRNHNGPQYQVQQTGPYILSIMVVAMIITFGFNYVITPWAFNWGLRNWAISASLASTAVILTYVPMIKYGKKLRQKSIHGYEKIINW